MTTETIPVNELEQLIERWRESNYYGEWGTGYNNGQTDAARQLEQLIDEYTDE